MSVAILSVILKPNLSYSACFQLVFPLLISFIYLLNTALLMPQNYYYFHFLFTNWLFLTFLFYPQAYLIQAIWFLHFYLFIFPMLYSLFSLLILLFICPIVLFYLAVYHCQQLKELYQFKIILQFLLLFGFQYLYCSYCFIFQHSFLVILVHHLNSQILYFLHQYFRYYHFSFYHLLIFHSIIVLKLFVFSSHHFLLQLHSHDFIFTKQSIFLAFFTSILSRSSILPISLLFPYQFCLTKVLLATVLQVFYGPLLSSFCWLI